jgi:LPXTG-site transpeptidase (sortase) family protein
VHAPSWGRGDIRPPPPEAPSPTAPPTSSPASELRGGQGAHPAVLDALAVGLGALAVAVAVAVTLVLPAGVVDASERLDGAVAPEVSQPPTQAPAALPSSTPPVAVDIPAIEVSAAVDPLTLERSGELAVPTDFERVGWWAGGSQPGAPGPTVLVGHLDSKHGPAVFYRLEKLEIGDRVEVRLTDDETVAYEVQRLASYSKEDFPTMEVYGPTEGSTLRLITCFGSFDRTTGHYRDNLVVFATETGAPA